jgi:hypothetical protein
LAGEAWRPGCVPNRPRSRRSSRSRSPRSCLRRWLTTPSCVHGQDQARSRRRTAALSLRGGADVSSLTPQPRSFGKTRDVNRPSRLMLTPRPRASHARGRSSSAARTKEKVFALSDPRDGAAGGDCGGMNAHRLGRSLTFVDARPQAARMPAHRRIPSNSRDSALQRRGRDSNPRWSERPTMVFESAPTCSKPFSGGRPTFRHRWLWSVIRSYGHGRAAAWQNSPETTQIAK